MAYKKYLLRPGFVFSEYDGKLVYVSATALMSCYKISPRLCVLHNNDRLKLLEPRRFFEDYVHLFPRQNGDYTLKEEDRLELQART